MSASNPVQIGLDGTDTGSRRFGDPSHTEPTGGHGQEDIECHKDAEDVFVAIVRVDDETLDIFASPANDISTDVDLP